MIFRVPGVSVLVNGYSQESILGQGVQDVNDGRFRPTVRSLLLEGETGKAQETAFQQSLLRIAIAGQRLQPGNVDQDNTFHWDFESQARAKGLFGFRDRSTEQQRGLSGRKKSVRLMESAEVAPVRQEFAPALDVRRFATHKARRKEYTLRADGGRFGAVEVIGPLHGRAANGTLGQGLLPVLNAVELVVDQISLSHLTPASQAGARWLSDRRRHQAEKDDEEDRGARAHKCA